MQESIVLIGAGSAMFTRGLVADLLCRNTPCTLALVDTDPAALAVAEGMTKKMIAMRQAPVTLRASTDRRDVLAGATAVICTIGVGGRRAWEQDVFIPRKYGIFQPVGDSVMPGGTSRALRMIPAMVAIAADVLDLAPSALFFNYGNPMGPVCRGVRKATGANIVGLCHGVNNVGHMLAEELGVMANRLKYTAVGMNHLTWFTELRVDGTDAMPQLRAIAREKRAQGFPINRLGAYFAEPGDAADGNMQRVDPFAWELTDLFGAFPAVLDRHITEFFPAMFKGEGSYYGKTLGIDAFRFEATIAFGDRLYEEMREVCLSGDPLPADYLEQGEGEHEQVMDIIESIRTDAGRIFSANLPNDGQIPNLPAAMVVESPVVADGGGVRPIVQSPLSPALAGTLATRLLWMETTVDAALEGNREKFIQALILDGAVDSVQTAERLADDLLAAQSAFLPQYEKVVR